MPAPLPSRRPSTTLDQPIGRGLSSEVYRVDSDRVLKLYLPSTDPAAVQVEFTATRLALSLGLPSPRPIALAERDGRHGILFEYLDGQTMARRYARRPIAFLAALRHLAHLHGAIHTGAAPGLPDQRQAVRAQIGRARVSDEVRRIALAALDRQPQGDRLCHGDLHPDNVVSMSDGLRIIDWQKATAGNPAADVARTELIIRYGRFQAGWLDRLRIPVASQALAAAWYVRCYCSRSGMPVSEIAAWRLPMMVVRLSGREAANEAQVRAAVERLARRHGTVGLATMGFTALAPIVQETLMLSDRCGGGGLL